MFERLFPRKKTQRPSLPQPDTQLALGALLVRIALADSTVTQSEFAAIDRILAASFGLAPLEAAKLRAVCTDLEMHAADPDEFARILRTEIAYGARKALAHAMWQVVMADGELADIEEKTLHDIEDALDLTAQDSAEVRQAALGGNA
ncbi:MAG: TerB family tellurite resistance protein [Paracoccaceae bacterium]